MNMRLAPVLAALAVALPSVMFAASEDAAACTVGPELISMPRDRNVSDVLPANFVMYSEASGGFRDWVDQDGDTIVFEAVDDPGLPENLFVTRPVSPLTPGQVISVKGCTGESCKWTIGAQDVTAPPRPKIAELEIYRDRRRLIDGPVAVCDAGDGEDHSLSFALEFDEEIEFPEQHTIWVKYEREDGSSLEDVPSHEVAELATGRAHNTGATLLYVYDELSFEHVLLRPDSPFCFRAALMDVAGNVSEWSELECVDPGNRRASYMTGPGACSIASLGTNSTMPSPQVPLLGLLFGLVALGVRRRRA